ncbi:MCE family protein [Nocardioides sp. GY 10113]|uniref:MCE family protein n=1 Tax=Nocardioides sp. GY 10113 TaxID=2569761 RepID=UPI0010A82666|nr:MCE family protein [Nocardioides sp. GY 10113]TIC89328.1 MCE family protein [Nocardioides sp. GY 10113]
MGGRMRSLLRGAAAVVAGAVLLSGCSFDVYELPLPGGADVGDDPIEVTAAFRDVLDLVPQSSVKVNDVSVGEVTDIRLSGTHAVVTLRLRGDTGLPDNATASIRQTSLLGEKFVSLDAPAKGGRGSLDDGDDIPLSATGRNPEVEEVLGAVSLILNGGGVAQLKSITKEVNQVLGGREDTARSVLTQVDDLVSRLDDRKAEIVDAIDAVDRLASTAREHMDSIDLALEELPDALDSLDGQREDLVAMLQGLSELGDVGTRVIRNVQDDTVDLLRDLNPVLTQINAAGDSFVRAFSTFVTFPFVDESVGRDPQVARNLHMGDYVNLSIDLDLDISGVLSSITDLACIPVNALPDLPLSDLLGLDNLCPGAQQTLRGCATAPADLTSCLRLPDFTLDSICDTLGLRAVCNLLGGGRASSPSAAAGAGGSGSGSSAGALQDLLSGVAEGASSGLSGLSGLLGLNRVAPGDARQAREERDWRAFDEKYDVGLLRVMSGPLGDPDGSREGAR